ncbi:sigma-70 family RNA polymerase sigma factor [Streptomyces finlayi]|uniref:Sigma-70 family RNA polymerase sigma factor n=1 Tax=Streptomyces finlayi TaxID=67296 RepID=A0A7G7BJE9_9ACTN|nr:RNA polymerase sigma factor [Streptomyces finlayi]QNE75464.1 sigma-70 family RNA polymerase sigma factor [Streptomyces finlayi]
MKLIVSGTEPISGNRCIKGVRTREGALHQGPEGGRTADDRAGGGAVGRAGGQPGGWAESGEAAVIARVRAGDAEAYAQLVRAHTGVALRVAVAFGAAADAEDVVQSAFFKAYQALGNFRDGAAFRPWLLRIVVNETRNTVRSAGRARAVAGREAGFHGADPLIPESADPAVAVLAEERRSLLTAALEGLSEQQRQVVTYRYLLEMDEAETARALGWPKGTVKSRLNRALKKLEKELRQEREPERKPERKGAGGRGGDGDGDGDGGVGVGGDNGDDGRRG